MLQLITWKNRSNFKFKLLSVLITLMIIISNIFGIIDLSQAAADQVGPDVIITELGPNEYLSTDVGDVPFLELYNRTNGDIDLSSYKLNIALNGSQNKYLTNPITSISKIIPAHKAMVISFYYSNDIAKMQPNFPKGNITSDNFYNLKYTKGGIDSIRHKDGIKDQNIVLLSYGATISLSNGDGSKSSSVTYNDSSDTNHIGHSYVYYYDANGNLIRSSDGKTGDPTPGVLLDGQVAGNISPNPQNPPSSITAPAIQNLTASNSVNVGNQFTVSASIYDNNSSVDASVYYGTSISNLSKLPLNITAVNAVYSASFTPTQPGTIYYYIQAVDKLGNSSILGNGVNAMPTTEAQCYSINVINQQSMTVSQAKALPVGTNVTLTGIITRSKGKQFYMQDDTAGICLYGDGISANVGDMVSVSGSIDNFKGTVEVTSPVVQVIKSNMPVNYKVVKISDLNKNYDSMVVKLQKVKITSVGAANSYIVDLTDASLKMEIYQTPALTGISEGDIVDVTAMYKSGYNDLDVASGSDIVKSDMTDNEKPVINHTDVVSASINSPLTIKANITDNIKVDYAKIYYRTKGQTAYKAIDMALQNGQYSVTIPKNELSLSGLEYYLEASDGTNIATYPADVQKPVSVNIIADDLQGPDINDLSPSDGVNIAKKRPVISAQIVDPSGFSDVKLFVDGTAVTYQTENSILSSDVEYISYTPTADLSVGSHTVRVEATDNSPAKNKSTQQATFTLLQIPDDSTVIPIAQAKKSQEGTNVVVQGVVTSKKGAQCYIQDDTGGICLYSSSIDAEAGDLVKATGPVNAYKETMEMKDPTAVTVEGKNVQLQYKTVKIADLSSDYDGMVIWIKNVMISGLSNPNSVLTDIKDPTKTVNIYGTPALSGINENDLVDVLCNYGASFKDVTVAQSSDIRKCIYIDDQPPVISHTPITNANIGVDVNVEANVTDNIKLNYVRLFYRVKGSGSYKALDMSYNNGKYSAVIPHTDLDSKGMEYYIETTDGQNKVTYPADDTNPLGFAVSDNDITGPVISNVMPVPNSSTMDKKPTVSAQFTDPSGISNVTLSIDGNDVTNNAVKTSNGISYTPSADFSDGDHTAKLVVTDNSVNQNSSTQEWKFTTGKQYNFYFGQLHGHSNISDGAGSPDEAYQWARDQGKADFFALTDHSDNGYFDNALSCNINDGSKSPRWNLLKSTADKYNVDGKFVAIAGYEMTFKDKVSGHLNTFCTDGFESASNPNMDLEKYYEQLVKSPLSISQFNHPGTTYGDFQDFSYWNPQIDKQIALIEVGNGDGQVRGPGYYPSYQYYYRALDKGWHVAPTNNGDNHKKQWITANTCRDVILAGSLTRDSIYDAIRNRRVYATEDSNLKILYTVNDQIMGSTLPKTSTLNFSVDVEDPDTTDVIKSVEIISNGGTVVASNNFTSNIAKWNFQLPNDSKYSYYYVRVDQADQDIAVTAPVWMSGAESVNFNSIDINPSTVKKGVPVDIKATMQNNTSKTISDATVDFYINAVKPENKINASPISVPSMDSGNKGIAETSWIPSADGEYQIIATSTVNVNGNPQTITQTGKIVVQDDTIEMKDIKDVRVDADKDGKPDLIGKRFMIQGTVTAGSEVGKHNSFFNCIYVQDATGGINVYGLSRMSIPVGTKVTVTGMVQQYMGDTELQISNDEDDIKITDDKLQIINPQEMSTGDSMQESNEGYLVKITGKVTKTTDGNLYINDGTGEARVFVDGYIGDGTDNQDMLGKWSKDIKVGDTVSAIGLASEDESGHRLRVRNTSEIVKVSSGDNTLPYVITKKSYGGNGYIYAEVTVNQAVYYGDSSVAVFELLKKNAGSDTLTPISIVTAGKDNNPQQDLSAGFNVGDDSSNYVVKVFVVDGFSNDPSAIGKNLADSLTLGQ